MCGIVGYVGKRSAQDVLLDGLEKLEYRGYDSAGVALALDGGIRVVKSKGRLTALREKLAAQQLAQSFCGIGHTRWATHGEPSDVNSHPHSTPRVSIVHNGIIENYGLLKERLAAKGYTFQSETDTEVLVKLIDSCYTGDPLRALQQALAKVRGSYALAVLFRDYPDTIFAVKRESPLIVGWGEGENFVASDIPALLKYTRKYSVLEEGDMAVCTTEGIRFYNEFGEPVERQQLTADWDMEAAEKGGYPHFMLKEIYEQPKVVKDNISSRFSDDGKSIKLDGIKLGKKELENINRIYIVACGTAFYAGQVGKFLIERIARIPVNSEVASEFRYKDPLIDEHTLMIVVSQSGETADTLAAMRLAQSKGARVLGVVNAVGSSIGREADDVLYTLAGPEIAVASTKAFSAQVVAMYLLTLHIAQELNKISPEEFAKIKAALEELPSLVNNILTKAAPAIEKFTQKYIHSKNVFYIGRGLDYIVGMEGSLKLKEIAYLHSEPYAAGELKHGPIALIEDSTLVVGIVTQEDLFEKTVSNIREVKARGAKVLAIAMSGNTEIEKYADDVIYIPRTHWMLTSLLANIPQQLFAYYMARDLGNDVDKPRNLAKSVTVE